MIDDPRVNFAVSMSGSRFGIDRLGSEGPNTDGGTTCSTPTQRGKPIAIAVKSSNSCG